MHTSFSFNFKHWRMLFLFRFARRTDMDMYHQHFVTSILRLISIKPNKLGLQPFPTIHRVHVPKTLWAISRHRHTPIIATYSGYLINLWVSIGYCFNARSRWYWSFYRAMYAQSFFHCISNGDCSRQVLPNSRKTTRVQMLNQCFNSRCAQSM